MTASGLASLGQGERAMAAHFEAMLVRLFLGEEVVTPSAMALSIDVPARANGRR